MAKSKRKSCLAVLREILGVEGKIEHFAAMIGKSTSWVDSASGNRIPLTREAVVQIGFVTGVNPEWLLSGDVNSTPTLMNSSVAFTREEFLRHYKDLKAYSPRLCDPFFAAAVEKIPRALLLILDALYAARQNLSHVDYILEQLEGLARTNMPNADVGLSDRTEEKFDSRKVAFARLVLRSSLARIKKKPQKQSTFQSSEQG